MVAPHLQIIAPGSRWGNWWSVNRQMRPHSHVLFICTPCGGFYSKKQRPGSLAAPGPQPQVHPYNPLATHLKQAFSTGRPVIHIVPILTAQFTLAITLPMTTVQETSNGHRVSPPPYDDATGIVSSDLSASAPTDKVHRERGISHELLPDRCQFTFSDGRQCTMARSDIHPSLCPFHAEREEQLFGSPSPGGNVVGAAFDLPELYSACRDLTTAAGVNRALAQVFRLLAQRRISRQEAATFGHLAQLLLRTISLAHAESADPTRMALARMQPARDAEGALNQRAVRVTDVQRGSSTTDESSPARPPSVQQSRT